MMKIKKYEKTMTIFSAIAAILIVTMVFSCKRAEGVGTLEEKEKVFEIKHGVNINHFLAQSTMDIESRASFFTEEDVRAIRGYGFDHIRLPIDENVMFKEDGSKEEDSFSLLKATIGYCMENDLRVVVDMHSLRSHSFTSGSNALFTSESEQEKFYEMWRQISGELDEFPTYVLAYELLNEPQAPTNKDWNDLVRNCYDAIRKLEPDRVIVIGTNPSQSYKKAKYLEVPQNDKNIIISFHYYDPYLLTHYRLSSTSQKDFNGAVQYPGIVLTREAYDAADCDEASKKTVLKYVGQNFDRTVFRKNFNEVVSLANKYGLQVYCGEYGCLPTVPQECRQAWHSDMETVFDELGISRAVWCYRDSDTGFGLIKNGVPDKVMYDPMNLN